MIMSFIIFVLFSTYSTPPPRLGSEKYTKYFVVKITIPSRQLRVQS